MACISLDGTYSICNLRTLCLSLVATVSCLLSVSYTLIFFFSSAMGNPRSYFSVIASELIPILLKEFESLPQHLPLLSTSSPVKSVPL